jgi:hypothetical protein
VLCFHIGDWHRRNTSSVLGRFVASWSAKLEHAVVPLYIFRVLLPKWHFRRLGCFGLFAWFTTANDQSRHVGRFVRYHVRVIYLGVGQLPAEIFDYFIFRINEQAPR